MVRTTRFWGWTVSSAAFLLASCGQPIAESKRTPASQADLDAVAAAQAWETQNAELKKSDDEAVVSTVLVKLDDRGEPMGLTGAMTQSGVVDMEARKPVITSVGAEKYLRVTGQLMLPESSQNKAYDIGCLDVELRDNVNWREMTWLRVSSTGMRGDKYSEINLPLSYETADGWKELPRLPDSETLIQFNRDSIKNYKGKICLRLDLTNAPSQKYAGEVVVQYLRPGSGTGNSDETAPPSVFRCASDAVALKAGQSTALTWEGFDPGKGGLTFSLSSDPAGMDRGQIFYEGGPSARYMAPASVKSPMKVMIAAKPPGGCNSLPAYCVVNLVPDADIGIVDDGETQGLVGNVYRLAANTPKLPDFTKMTPIANIVAPNLDVPQRSFESGFPGVRDLVEWFGIRFTGSIEVPADGEYEFNLVADDGANLYINDVKVIDNDGIHATKSVKGKVWLKKGKNKFRVEWFQGPRFHITLQLFWRSNPADGFKIVPPEAFSRPLQ